MKWFSRRGAQPGPAPDPAPPRIVAVKWKDDYSFEGDEGEDIRGRGYLFTEQQPGSHDPPIGMHVCKLAGLSHRGAAAQSAALDPGAWVHLIAEPRNEYDKNAVGVWDVARRTLLGYLPGKDVAPIVSPRLLAGAVWWGVVIWEWVDPDGARCGAKLLIGDGTPPRLVIDPNAD